MFIYRIIAIFLMASPIVIRTDFIFFPYSMLGFTLYFMTIVLDQKHDFYDPADILLWIIALMSIISQTPISYSLVISFFCVLQYFYMSLKFKSSVAHFFIIIGLISSTASVFVPMFTLISLGILGILMIIQYQWEHRKYKNPILFEEEQLIDIYIPAKESSIDDEEKNFVIPNNPAQEEN